MPNRRTFALAAAALAAALALPASSAFADEPGARGLVFTSSNAGARGLRAGAFAEPDGAVFPECAVGPRGEAPQDVTQM